MVVADGLVPVWCQGISNHLDDAGQLVNVRVPIYSIDPCGNEFNFEYVMFDTILGWDKLAEMLQTTILKAFSWLKIVLVDSNCSEVCSYCNKGQINS